MILLILSIFRASSLTHLCKEKLVKLCFCFSYSGSLRFSRRIRPSPPETDLPEPDFPGSGVRHGLRRLRPREDQLRHRRGHHLHQQHAEIFLDVQVRLDQARLGSNLLVKSNITVTYVLNNRIRVKCIPFLLPIMDVSIQAFILQKRELVDQGGNFNLVL